MSALPRPRLSCCAQLVALLVLQNLVLAPSPRAYPAPFRSDNRQDIDRGGAASTVLERLRRIVPAVQPAASCMRARQLAGRYSAETPELAEMMGGGYLGGSSLYLFWNGSYMYSEWTDISPETIEDQGRWFRSADMLELKSDDLRHEPKYLIHDTHFFVFCLPTAAGTGLRIIGTKDELTNLEKDAGKDGEQDDQLFRLMMYSRERREVYRSPEGSRQMMKELRQRLGKSDLRP